MELYHEPANLFVAGFLGAPSMNFWRKRCWAKSERLAWYQIDRRVLGDYPQGPTCTGTGRYVQNLFLSGTARCCKAHPYPDQPIRRVDYSTARAPALRGNQSTLGASADTQTHIRPVCSAPETLLRYHISQSDVWPDAFAGAPWGRRHDNRIAPPQKNGKPCMTSDHFCMMQSAR
jgi:hypothetical protein